MVFWFGTCFANGRSTMKDISNRMWLVIVGVAVAVIVTLTTFIWTEPQPMGNERKSLNPSGNKTVSPKIGQEALRYLLPTTLPRRN